MTTDPTYTVHTLNFADDLDDNLRADIADDDGYDYELYGSYDGCDHNLGYVQILWCPETMRAGLVYVGSGSSGATSWTDASGPEDALRRYLEDEMVG